MPDPNSEFPGISVSHRLRDCANDTKNFFFFTSKPVNATEFPTGSVCGTPVSGFRKFFPRCCSRFLSSCLIVSAGVEKFVVVQKPEDHRGKPGGGGEFEDHRSQGRRGCGV